jgi:tetratricopeptide (TPR) repeat protein
MAPTPLEIAQAFVSAGELADALEPLNQHLAANADDQAARRLRIAVLMRLPGDDHQRMALADLDSLSDPGAEDEWRRSIVWQTLGDLGQAADVLAKARTRWPDDEGLIERHLYLLMHNRDYAGAQTLLATLPRTWRWLIWAGDVAMEYTTSAEAVACYTEALADLDRQFDVASNPFAANIQAQLFLSRAHAYMGDQAHVLADADFAAAQSIIPDDLMIPFYRGLIAAERGDLVMGISLCGEALNQANDWMRESMESMLRINPRYAGLVALLFQGDADV